MRISRSTLAGILIFSGSAVFLIGMMLAETLAPAYTARKAISDLGVGTTAPLFAASIITFGILVIAGAVLLYRNGTVGRLFCILLSIAGAGAIGTGLFPETLGLVHVAAAFTVFFFGAISALYSMRIFAAPWSWLSAALGAISLFALGLIGAGITAGIGFGGVERMAAYPLIIWALGTGGYLMAGTPCSPPGS